MIRKIYIIWHGSFHPKTCFYKGNFYLITAQKASKFIQSKPNVCTFLIPTTYVVRGKAMFSFIFVCLFTDALGQVGRSSPSFRAEGSGRKEAIPVADLGGARDACPPPPPCQDFFIFMQFSGKLGQIIG